MQEHEDLQYLGKSLKKELAQIYSAENELLSALPDLINATETYELKEALLSYLRQTQLQLARLERAGRTLGAVIESTASPAIKGILVECDHLLDGDGEEYLHDLLLAAMLERLVHFQIGTYSALIRIAQYTGQEQVTELLHKNLEEENAADEAFAGIIEDLLSLQDDELGGDDDVDDDYDEDDDDDDEEDDDLDDEELDDDELDDEVVDEEELEDEEANPKADSKEPRRNRIM